MKHMQGAEKEEKKTKEGERNIETEEEKEGRGEGEGRGEEEGIDTYSRLFVVLFCSSLFFFPLLNQIKIKIKCSLFFFFFSCPSYSVL